MDGVAGGEGLGEKRRGLPLRASQQHQAGRSARRSGDRPAGLVRAPQRRRARSTSARVELLRGLIPWRDTRGGCRRRRRRSLRSVARPEQLARRGDLVALGEHAFQIRHVIARLFRGIRVDRGSLAARRVVRAKFIGTLRGARKRHDTRPTRHARAAREQQPDDDRKRPPRHGGHPACGATGVHGCAHDCKPGWFACPLGQ